MCWLKVMILPLIFSTIMASPAPGVVVTDALSWHDLMPWNWGASSNQIAIPVAQNIPPQVGGSASSLTPLGEVKSNQPSVHSNSKRDLIYEYDGYD